MVKGAFVKIIATGKIAEILSLLGSGKTTLAYVIEVENSSLHHCLSLDELEIQ